MRHALTDARRALDELMADAPALDASQRAVDAIVASLRAGGKVLICGNGGSSCDAAHFAEELTGRFRNDRRPLAAIACTDVGHVTCTANDYGFEHVFSRWITALARPGDVVIVLSTSGNSANIVRAAEAARAVGGVATIAMLGKDGGKLAGVCDHQVIVPGATSDRIQELHMLLLHAWCEEIERQLGIGGRAEG